MTDEHRPDCWRRDPLASALAQSAGHGRPCSCNAEQPTPSVALNSPAIEHLLLGGLTNKEN